MKRKTIKDLGKFYYHFDFDGVTTRKEMPHRGANNWKHLDPIMKDVLGNFDHPKVLDVGCNMGLLSYEMSKLGANVVGIEHSKRYFKQAKFFKEYIQKTDKDCKIEFRHLDVVKDDLPFEGIDVVTFFGVIYWIAPNHDFVIEKINNLFPDHKYVVLQGNTVVKTGDMPALAQKNGMVNFLEKHGYTIDHVYNPSNYTKPIVVGKK